MMTAPLMRSILTAGRVGAILVLTLSSAASAATFGELSSAMPGNGSAQQGYAAGPYASVPSQPCPPECAVAPQRLYGGPEGVAPVMPGERQAPYFPPGAANPRAYLPMNPSGDLPHDQLMLWTFGQVNSTTDPANPWGLNTPFMYVPWSTPLSGWTNAQTWNWWRERSGALPRNW